jgi:PadR family transcriptional regulator PadR
LAFEKEMLKGFIDIIILSMLYHEDLYGYELAKRVKQKTGKQFELKEGTLYLAFKRMEQSNLIESYWGSENIGGRRKYYKLLPQGLHHIQKRKQEWKNIREMINMFLEGVD